MHDQDEGGSDSLSDDDSGTGANARLEFTTRQSGPYYVRILGHGTYTLTVTER